MTLWDVLATAAVVALIMIGFVMFTVKRFEREDRQLRSAADEDRIRHWESDDAA